MIVIRDYLVPDPLIMLIAEESVNVIYLAPRVYPDASLRPHRSSSVTRRGRGAGRTSRQGLADMGPEVLGEGKAYWAARAWGAQVGFWRLPRPACLSLELPCSLINHV